MGRSAHRARELIVTERRTGEGGSCVVFMIYVLMHLWLIRERCTYPSHDIAIFRTTYISGWSYLTALT